MILDNKKVAIVGAGPVGLTMARLLQQKGADVTVYERDKDPHARIWGGTLDLHTGSGQAALRQAGLFWHYFSSAMPMGRTITDEQGNVLFSVAAQHDSPEINRTALRKILLDSLAGDTVVWNRKFTRLEAHNGMWHLHFENKTHAPADLVIGANGGLSSVREYITDATVEDTGTYIIQGEVSQPEIRCSEFYQFCHQHILMAAGAGINFVVNPCNNGALTYNVTFRTPEAWHRESELNFQDTDSVAVFLSARFARWHERFHRLFRATSFYKGLPTRKLSFTIPWRNDRPLPVTLLGDAAHIMPPFAGEGVNTGLVDASILSDNLTNRKFETLEAAIANYEQRMFVYAAKAQRETSKNEIEMHEPGFSFIKRFERSQPGKA